jgi:hypothetical protein
MKTLASAAAASILALSAFGMAEAAPVTGGQTVVFVTADLDALDLAATPIDDVDFDGRTFAFDITGGDVDPVTYAGQIFHEGSGLQILAGGEDVTATVTITDFVIDTVASQVFGNVSVETGGAAEALGQVAIFDFDLSALSDIDDLFDLSDPALPLTVTTVAGQALLPVLGLDLSGVEFGLAATAPGIDADPIPLPGAALFFATGAAAFAARKRKAAMQA